MMTPEQKRLSAEVQAAKDAYLAAGGVGVDPNEQGHLYVDPPRFSGKPWG